MANPNYAEWQRRLAKFAAARPPLTMITLTTGAAAGSNIAVASPSGNPAGAQQITPDDFVLAIFDVTTAGSWVDRTTDFASIPSKGNITMGGATTAAKQLLIFWSKFRLSE